MSGHVKFDLTLYVCRDQRRKSDYSNKAVMEVKEFDEFVSDILVDSEAKTMVASSGEGTILVSLCVCVAKSPQTN